MELLDRLRLRQGQMPCLRGVVWAWGKGFPPERSIRRELFTVLAAAIGVAFGPDALLATTHVSAILIQILLGLCRNCFPVLRILGM